MLGCDRFAKDGSVIMALAETDLRCKAGCIQRFPTPRLSQPTIAIDNSQHVVQDLVSKEERSERSERAMQRRRGGRGGYEREQEKKTRERERECVCMCMCVCVRE
eukprot:1156985-Rhodomonas_salina.3